MSHMIGKTLSHFRIVEKLGEGGMGVVYRAEDTRLRRAVALKVLPPELVGNEERRLRFLREARAAAAVTHPNIATVYEVGEAGGIVFIAMELVEGKTLRDLIGGKPMAIREALRLATEVADGLARAHQAHVIHRDLKPDNVIVGKDGRAKILDFGLAKLLEERAAAGRREPGWADDGSRAGGEELSKLETISGERTREGSIFGTAAYMSPEQARGQPLDARSDIFSLGTTLYEMVTARSPFGRKTGTDTLSAILRDQPVPAARVNPEVPPDLDRLIGKCLEKDARDRYQHADDIVVDLRRLERQIQSDAPGAGSYGAVREAPLAAPAAGVAAGTTPVPAGRVPWPGRGPRAAVLISALALAAAVGLSVALNVGGLRDRVTGSAGAGRIDSLAVLPLENLSGDPQQEYFSDGMTEALITNLAHIRSLKVISRTSVMRYKGVRKALPEIGSELGVDAVVEGSVLRSGERVRVTAQLIEAATDRHLWAQSYERDLRDVLALQGEVARAIAGEIEAALTPQEKARLAGARAVNPEAYEAYLKGRYYQAQRTAEAVRKGIEFFERAIALDPVYAPAYSGLADSYLVMGSPNLPPREKLERAREAAQKALEIDPTQAEAYASMGAIKQILEHDRTESERNYQRAIELNPNYATAHRGYGISLSYWGRHDEALRELGRARELDPLSLAVNANFGRIFYHQRQYDRAVEECLRTLELDPDYALTHYFLGLAYLEKGRYPEAVRALEKALPDLGGVAALGGELGNAYARAGRRPEALALLEEMERLSRREYVSAAQQALVHVGLGRKDEALRLLALAVEGREASPWGLAIDPRWDPLRSEPRFQELVRRASADSK